MTWMKTAGKFNAAESLKELDEKPLEQIQEETAFKWGSRALAALSKYEDSGKLKWLLDANEYAHEAIEHAALVESSNGEVIKQIQSEVVARIQFAIQQLQGGGSGGRVQP